MKDSFAIPDHSDVYIMWINIKNMLKKGRSWYNLRFVIGDTLAKMFDFFGTVFDQSYHCFLLLVYVVVFCSSSVLVSHTYCFVHLFLKLFGNRMRAHFSSSLSPSLSCFGIIPRGNKSSHSYRLFYQKAKFTARCTTYYVLLWYSPHPILTILYFNSSIISP